VITPLPSSTLYPIPCKSYVSYISYTRSSCPYISVLATACVNLLFRRIFPISESMAFGIRGFGMKSFLAKTDGMGASLFRRAPSVPSRQHADTSSPIRISGDSLPVLRLFSVKAAVAELFATAVFVYIGTGTVGIGPVAAPRRSLALTRATVRFARLPGRHFQLPRRGWRSRRRIHQRDVELYRSHVGGQHDSGHCGSVRKDPGVVDRL